MRGMLAAGTVSTGNCHHDSHRETTVIKNDMTTKNRLMGGFVFSSISLIHKEKIGAGERSRTLDLLITNELLYQLSYTGVSAMPHKWDTAKPAILAQDFQR